MYNIWLIARREYKTYFTSPVAYIVTFFLLLALGIIFYEAITSAIYYNTSQSQSYAPDAQLILSPLATIFLFTIPALTMRSLPEEQKTGTFELLLTSPIRDVELVIGKWLGAFLFVLTILLITLTLPFILNRLVTPGIDMGVAKAGYLGIILMAASFTAIGIATASLFSNQIAAFFATLGILLALSLIGSPLDSSNSIGTIILNFINISNHFNSTFSQGIVQLSDVVYYISLTALGLFLGTVSVESRRWR
jgi:ABC-2 type transport system permease protein